MSALGQIVMDLEAYKGRSGMQNRNILVRKLADEFVSRLDTMGDAQVEAFDTVLFNLARDLDMQGRIDLSSRLSTILRAPYRTIRDFAMDRRHPVAAPVIEFSPRLSEADLVVIACHQGQEHLLSMTKREALTELVTDLLVERGERAVQYNVARNPNALLSAGSLYKLQLIALNDAILRESFVRRHGPAPDPLLIQAEPAQELAPSRCLSAADSEVDDETMIINGRGFVFLGSTHANDLKVRDRFERRPPRESDILRSLEDGQPGEAAATIALMARLPIANVIEYLTSPKLEQTLTLLKSASLSWECARAILEYKACRELTRSLSKTLEARYSAALPAVGKSNIRNMIFESRALEF